MLLSAVVQRKGEEKTQPALPDAALLVQGLGDEEEGEVLRIFTCVPAWSVASHGAQAVPVEVEIAESSAGEPNLYPEFEVGDRGFAGAMTVVVPRAGAGSSSPRREGATEV